MQACASVFAAGWKEHQVRVLQWDDPRESRYCNVNPTRCFLVFHQQSHSTWWRLRNQQSGNEQVIHMDSRNKSVSL